MCFLLLIGCKVVADAEDDRIDHIQPSLFLDLPNRSVLKGFPRLQIASRDGIVRSMRTFSFSNKDKTFGVDQQDADADVGAGAWGVGHGLSIATMSQHQVGLSPHLHPC